MTKVSPKFKRVVTSFFHRVRQVWRFKRFLRRSDFLNALRIANQEQWSLDGDQRYCLFRLGCYISATHGATDPKSARETVALAVSFACQGERDKHRKAVNVGLPYLRKNRRLLIECARGLAKYDPLFARSMLSNEKGAEDLVAALEFKIGNLDRANTTISSLTRPSNKSILNGFHLIFANLEIDPLKKLFYLNHHLEALGLRKLILHNSEKQPMVLNVSSCEEFKKTTGPLVSIILPAYQAKRWIFHTISSLQNQQYENIEIIVVDDGSTDGTQKIVSQMASLDNRIQYFRLDDNSGAYAARNLGLDAANGAYITVNDADDYALPEKIEKQVRPMIEDPYVVFTLSDLVRLDDDGVFGYRDVYPIQRINPSSLMFRRAEVFPKFGYWQNVRFGADSEYIARLKSHYSTDRWQRIKLPLSLAASHGQSLTTCGRTGNSEEGMNVKRMEYTESYVGKIVEISAY